MSDPVLEEIRMQKVLNQWQAMQAGMSYEEYLLQFPETIDRVVGQVDDLIRRKVAKREFDGLVGGGFKEPLLETLDAALERGVEPVTYRIDHMMVEGHNTNIAASYKVGKTTLLVNRVRSYVDGVPFMGSFDVKPVDGRVVVFNYEVSDNQFVSWLDRVKIENQHKVSAVNLRGKNFFIQDDDACEWAIKALRQMECEVWEVDPLSAAIRGNTKDEEVASDFIARIERIKDEAGVKDLVLTTHTGHLSGYDSNGRAANERTSGSARFLGWPDALWTYTKDAQEHRYLSVLGRDVECEEFQVLMDPATIRLTDAGQGTSRVAGKDQRLWQKLLRTVADAGAEGVTATALKDLASSSSAVTKLRAQGVDMGALDEAEVPNGKRGPNPTVVRLTPLGERLVQQLGN